LPVFQNKKRIFEVFDFSGFRRDFPPELRADAHRWMCVHTDANRTPSRLSCAPVCRIFHNSIKYYSTKTNLVKSVFPKPKISVAYLERV